MSAFLLILALTLNAAANVLLKIGAKAGTVPAGSLAEKALQFFNGVTVIALILFALNIIFYRKALEKIDLSVAYPIMLSGSLLIATLAAWTLPQLRERITPAQLGGMCLIIIGVWVVCYQRPQAPAAPAIHTAVQHLPGGTDQ